MRARTVFAFCLATLLAGCGPASEEATVTTSTSTTTTTAPTTTTVPTTITTAPTTTTTALTTTTRQLQGNWAGQPLVAYDDWGGIALGWWDGSDWVQVDADTTLPVTGGEDYQVALLGSEAVLEGGSPENDGCDVVFPEGLPGVQFDDGNALYTIVDDGTGGERSVSGVAVSAGWSLTPRPVMAGESHPDLEALAIGLLEERDFETNTVEIIQVVDADLDGDGAIETFLVAEDTELGNEGSGVYSILFAVSPFWDEPVIIAESVIPEDETGFPASLRVSAIADLSGDGKMEIVVDGLAWESSWVTVYEWSGTSFEDRIGAGCGV